MIAILSVAGDAPLSARQRSVYSAKFAVWAGMQLRNPTFKLMRQPMRKPDRSIRFCLLFALGAIIAPAWVWGQDQPLPPGAISTQQVEGQAIARIEFEGVETLDRVYLEGVTAIHVGDIWERAKIAEAVRRLTETNKFEGTPYAEPRLEGSNLVLVFVLVERPFVRSIDFEGNKKFDDGDLLKEIKIEVGSPISEFLLRQSEQQIEQKYKDEGYGHATARVDQEMVNSERRVLFHISEGPRVKVRKILFEGNTSITDRRLKKQIETNTYIWLFRTGAFDPEKAERDVTALKAYYNDRGYLNAQVGYRTEFEENESDLTLTFQIEEGEQHRIKELEVQGNAVFTREEIFSKIKSLPGEIIDADIVKADRQKILDEYGRRGYIYCDVDIAHVFDEEDAFVDVTIRIREGDPYHVGRIVVRGNRVTKDRVVRRQIQIFPEEIYDGVAAKESQQNLLESRLFNEATVTPQGETPGVRDALVTVTEADTTSIIFGVGITSNNGLIGSISLEQKNFDIMDRPRTLGEFFRGKSFRGAGQTMRITLEPGTEVSRGRIDFREPYLFDQELGMGVGAYVFERARDEYDEGRVGGYVSFDKRYREGIFKDWASEVALKLEGVDISGTDWLTAKEIQDDKGTSFLTSVKGSLIHDRTDSRWLPSLGDRLKLSWEQFGALGGDYTFAQLMAEYDKYWTIYTDTFDRKHIIQVGGTAGQMLGSPPVFERFYAGGMGSIRGFAFRGISPREGIKDDRVGGDFMLLTNAAYSFPIVGTTVRGVTFVDMGTVEEDFGLHTWRASVGAGVRIYIKYFGPIPLAFDLAAPVAKDDDDDTQIFSFSFGTTF